jgi:uncharacterized protein YcnI
MVLLWGGAAGAHVTISPSSVPQGTSDVVLTFRVPNESATADVIGLRLQFPTEHPIIVVSPEAGSGWQVAVQSTRLPQPITTDDGTFSSTVSEVDWSAGTIPVGQFGVFTVLAQGIPSGTDKLVFKAIQQYGDGTSVSWIQIPDAAAPNPDHPAPTLGLTSRGAGNASGAARTATTVAPGAVVTGASPGGSSGLAVVSLIVAGFAVVLALLAVWLGRPQKFDGSRQEEDGAGSGPG